MAVDVQADSEALGFLNTTLLPVLPSARLSVRFISYKLT